MITVSQLISAAQKHLEEYGDGPVGVVLWDPEHQVGDHDVLCIAPATETGEDQYDNDGPRYFEIEASFSDDHD